MQSAIMGIMAIIMTALKKELMGINSEVIKLPLDIINVFMQLLHGYSSLTNLH